MLKSRFFLQGMEEFAKIHLSTRADLVVSVTWIVHSASYSIDGQQRIDNS
jgi:hypothetical protein